MIFRNREDAGKKLARKIKEVLKREALEDAIVLALPRGGLPIGAAIRDEFQIPMDAFLVRKIGAPGYAELAMGALAMGGAMIVNEEVFRMFNPSEEVVEHLIKTAENELKYQNTKYRKGRAMPEVKDKVIILVDDGLATGATMRAAIAGLKKMGPKKIIVAVPVAATDTLKKVQKEADQVICLFSTDAFSSVGQWYEDFSQVTDEETEQLLHPSEE
ncbi:MAG: phosphoribosyl transferase [Verrucomicrobia bacterium]|nr:MAG: phosphoribosyl transferase [Verrucomicrobiota bacterium]